MDCPIILHNGAASFNTRFLNRSGEKPRKTQRLERYLITAKATERDSPKLIDTLKHPRQ
jgi:hypothetical protein